MPDQRIEKRKQAIDTIARRTAAARSKRKFVALLFQGQAEDGVVELRSHAFSPANFVPVLPSGQFQHLPAQRVNHRL